jgi:hypothetical protein
MSESSLRYMVWFAMQSNTEGLEFQQNSQCIVVRSKYHLVVLALQRRTLPASAAKQVSPVFTINVPPREAENPGPETTNEIVN